MFKKIKAEKVNKDTIILEYVNEYIKMLPIIEDILKSENDNILKQESDIYIIKSNEHMEEQ